MHVSTTYNNLDKEEIAEEIYPGSLDPQKLVDLVDSMDDVLLASISKQYKDSFLNHSFHKSIKTDRLKLFEQVSW